ncbi:leucyl/phenylalanyl-tRNA--protein transferase [Solemya velum gill symbiont]|uniref:Leucyl/phenylalanyl-tRNA--protein transferase n=7 Tax=Solemya velum gill symbiont TaxID=2340 RepID=A0A0B0HAQ7_SOVGS|nr:leucyl/phenylalanyl-tRNA--protein transferase [Solemya velum gill symbiont]KHF24924.1 leucyl/phenylalanyl-tRNA-protein transferase [Solemya velum gill symbiont]OOY34589.1 leucyl/phenylalanyl-tRNA--protein transferase [Solemya velum gill symbiont]OOY37381.1 leucyl/phenylalanyl-tRNA--protein transferase [Solemya velum gill symbiont]OOY41550.1 leucyl/phenylalanyl-tRNA--protein transferase [Solemya velum gill symbiont]OOY50788.1 leucyl/phenylalanyl-tRNA--protein transferase [Solemya velum gill 
MAEKEPDGLLAAGGDLEPIRLVNAYSSGIFPWYSEGQPILWWSPDPRTLLFPGKLHISRSLAKRLRQGRFEISFDLDFNRVVSACATVSRKQQDGTWIVDKMQAAYKRMHILGFAHSVEVWQDKELVGGLYGMSIGKAFYGESMFSLVPDASKVALVMLTKRLLAWGFHFIDCQVVTSHLVSLGAETVTRQDFLQLNQLAVESEEKFEWRQEAVTTNDA